MKTLLKILTPAISTLGIATIALTSCQNPKGDGYVAIPTTYLNIINNTELEGLTATAETTDLASMGYSKLTIPKAITEATISYQDTKIGYNAIQKVDYESDSVCTNLIVSGLTNLVCIVLPPKIVYESDTSTIITIPETGKLNTIDISNVENIDYLKNENWIKINNPTITTGTLIAKKGTDADIATIKTNNKAIENWTVVYK